MLSHHNCFKTGFIFDGTWRSRARRCKRQGRPTVTMQWRWKITWTELGVASCVSKIYNKRRTNCRLKGHEIPAAPNENKTNKKLFFLSKFWSTSSAVKDNTCVLWSANSLLQKCVDIRKHVHSRVVTLSLLMKINSLDPI